MWSECFGLLIVVVSVSYASQRDVGALNGTLQSGVRAVAAGGRLHHVQTLAQATKNHVTESRRLRDDGVSAVMRRTMQQLMSRRRRRNKTHNGLSCNMCCFRVYINHDWINIRL